MKALNTVKMMFMSTLVMITAWQGVKAQENDDLYFNSSDRQTVKVDKSVLKSQKNAIVSNTDYKEISASTENFSAKNVNPEYIAKYKDIEEDGSAANAALENGTYSGDDYFVEDYESQKQNHETTAEDYLNSKKYDRNYTSNAGTNASSNTGFMPNMSVSTYMGFGGSPYGYSPYGYGMGYGPSYGMSIGMSWGMGYNPWNSFYSPYSMYYSPYSMYYDPWRSPYRSGFYDPFYSPFGYSSYNPYRYGSYGYYGYGSYCPLGLTGIAVASSGSSASNSYYTTENGTRIEYRPRTATRSNSSEYVRSTSGANDRIRRVENSENIRTVTRSTPSSTSGRVAKDYAATQNEYYNNSRTGRTSTSRTTTQPTSTSISNRLRSSSNSSSRDYSSSAINTNRPSRTDSYNSGSTYQRNMSTSGSSGRSSSSYSSPSRSSYSRSSGSSSYSSGSSGSSSSSYSSGSRSSSSSSSGRRP